MQGSDFIVLKFYISIVSSGRPTCEKKADIAFVMDTSQLINSSSLKWERDFVKAVAESFYIEPEESRAALITYNETTRVRAKMGEHTNVQRFQQAVDSVIRTGGGLRLDRALKQAFAAIFINGSATQIAVPKVCKLKLNLFTSRALALS